MTMEKSFRFQIKREREGGAQTVQVVRQATPTKCTLDLETESLERVMGIEPTLSAWEAEVLPLNYTRASAHVYREVSRVSKGATWSLW